MRLSRLIHWDFFFWNQTWEKKLLNVWNFNQNRRRKQISNLKRERIMVLLQRISKSVLLIVELLIENPKKKREAIHNYSLILKIKVSINFLKSKTKLKYLNTLKNWKNINQEFSFKKSFPKTKMERSAYVIWKPFSSYFWTLNLN